MKRTISYIEKLRDPRWQRRRLERLSLSDFTCENCGSTTKTLHVHHKQYLKGREPWEYEDALLEVLCEDCHKGEHDALFELDRLLVDLTTEQINHLVGVAKYLVAWDQAVANDHMQRRISLNTREQAVGFTLNISGLPPEFHRPVIEQLSSGDLVLTPGDLWDMFTRDEGRAHG